MLKSFPYIARPVTSQIYRSDKMWQTHQSWFALLRIRQPSPCDLKPQQPSRPLVKFTKSGYIHPKWKYSWWRISMLQASMRHVGDGLQRCACALGLCRFIQSLLLILYCMTLCAAWKKSNIFFKVLSCSTPTSITDSIFKRLTKVRINFEWLGVYTFALSWLDELRSGEPEPKDVRGKTSNGHAGGTMPVVTSFRKSLIHLIEIWSHRRLLYSH